MSITTIRSNQGHTVEKIGGTSMSDYAAVLTNIVLRGQPREALNEIELYQRIFVVSAYGGFTDRLLEHKKNGRPGVFGFFAESSDDTAWRTALDETKQAMLAKNAELFGVAANRSQADDFIRNRVDDAYRVLDDLHRVCQHGHFAVENQLRTVREMLASLGEAHSAWNTAALLRQEGINAEFVDLSGWQGGEAPELDDRIRRALEGVDLSNTLPIVTGYAHCDNGLMQTFDRGYSEMTFSRIAVVTGAAEAVIHKEYHLSSADPRMVGETKVVPIGRTNYDVADQLANLGMEAIHPRAAIGLRRANIPLRVKNTFEPNHKGTLITRDYVSEQPCVEIIAGHQDLHAIQIFDQDMVANNHQYDQEFLQVMREQRVESVTRCVNANTIVHYVSASLKKVKRIMRSLEQRFEEAEVSHQPVALVAAIGSDMEVAGMLAQAVGSLADAGISVLGMHQSMRQVDMQFVVKQADYEAAVRALHQSLIEPHEHGVAICAA